MQSISLKLFFALLSLTTLVLVATLLLARWSFDQGFLDYLNSQQQRRLTNMATDLSEHYVDNGYKWTEETTQAYQETYRKWFPGPAQRHPPLTSGRRHRDSIELGRDGMRKGGAERPPPPPRSRFKRERGKALLGPVVVLDNQGAVIAGYLDLSDEQEILSVDILNDEKIIGKIQTIKRVKLSSGGESSFSKQQTHASYIIAIVSLLIASIASWALSRMLLAPTYKMKASIASLVKGDFSERLTVMGDDELGQLMGDINRLSETLEANRTSRRRWLADISHELRTPVAILAGELDAVLDEIRPLNRQTIESLNHEVIRLKHLIDDLYQLSLSDIGGLRYSFSQLNITKLLELVISQHAQRFDSAEMKLKVDIAADVYIYADEARLEQLFTNIINNSISYTDAPGQIQICLKEEGSNVLISFSDSAPGLETDVVNEIFEPLFREDASRNRRVGGAGLGLAICKNIVHGHHGSISAQPSGLGGLEFIVTLPVNKEYKGD